MHELSARDSVTSRKLPPPFPLALHPLGPRFLRARPHRRSFRTRARRRSFCTCARACSFRARAGSRLRLRLRSSLLSPLPLSVFPSPWSPTPRIRPLLSLHSTPAGRHDSGRSIGARTSAGSPPRSSKPCSLRRAALCATTVRVGARTHTRSSRALRAPISRRGLSPRSMHRASCRTNLFSRPQMR
ncbi:hypothetical protein B0H11DRAFT_2025148, partial [Mycena galericulata]